MQNESLSRASYSDFQPVIPQGKTLLDFQRAGVEYMTRLPRCINADQMGLGKTVQAIATMNTLGIDSYIVVCPASLVDNWIREINAWSTSPFQPTRFQSAAGATCGIWVASYGIPDRIAELARVTRCRGIIFDEAHYLKNPKSKRTKSLLETFDRECVLCLTGTPIVNRPIDLYPLLSRLIAPSILQCRTLHQFGVRYTNPVHNGWGWEYRGIRNAAALGKILRSHCMVRRLKTDVLHSLPAKIKRGIYLDATSEAEHLVEQEVGYHDLHLRKRLTPEAGKAAMLIRTSLGFLKVGPAAEYIKTLLDGGCEKVVVFGFHRDPMAVLLLKLAKYCPVVITGGTPKNERQQRVDRFQNDPKCRVFIGSIQAAGVGITLTAASRVVIFETSWVPGENEQAEDRCHRIGQHNSVIVDYLIFRNSADERVIAVSRDKSATISTVIDPVMEGG